MEENRKSKRSYKNITREIKELICSKYEAGKSLKCISEDLDVNYSTTSEIIRRYKADGQCIKMKRGCSGRKKSLNDADFHAIKNEISMDASVTLQHIQKRLAENNKNVSISTIHRAIDSFEYSLKRIQLIPVRRNAEINIEARFNYARAMLEVDFNRMIFIDEMGVNCSMRKRYGRAPIGETPRKDVTTLRSKNLSICAAITYEELLFFEVKERAYNSDLFLGFIQNILLMLQNKTDMILICDNAPIHKKDEIKIMVANHGHAILFLPPYSPQLNPIEETFGVWKGYIRAQNCNDSDQLLDAIQTSSTKITSTHCKAFYQHMRKFLIKAMARENF